MVSWSRRWLAAVGVVMGVAGAVASPVVAWADPPGPTDFRTTIVTDVPAGITVAILGGDSFLQVTADPGVAVSVAGYQGEPFVEYLPDGDVRENRASPSYWISQSKDGASLPAGVSADSPVEWVTVASDGSYAWHDHRTHLMGAPVGAPGDVVARGDVPFVIDGAESVVSFETTWLPAASPLPAIVGAIAGLAAAAWAAVSYRRGQATAAAAVGGAAAAAALAIGLTQFVSLPRVVGAPWTLWVLPLTALVALAATSRWRGPTADALCAVAGVELVLWALARRSGLTAAILPTDTPFWLDRAITAFAGVVGVGLAASALVALVATITAPPSGLPHRDDALTAS